MQKFKIIDQMIQKLEWKQMDGRTDQQQYLDSYGVVQKGRAGLRN